ncbi:hypothetical protein PFISCL1PPCAC_29209, partial [Pristionchus fissidentatus]
AASMRYPIRFLLSMLLLAAVVLSEYDSSIGANVCQDGDWQCDVDATCCVKQDGSTGCCPFTLGTCCPGDTCCPAGFKCGSETVDCQRIQ